MPPETSRLRLTRHARNRMRWHRINEEQVRECIMEPSREEPATEGKTHSWVSLGEKFLRVTWVEEEGVTVDLDEKGHIVGIEILDATEKLGLESLLNVSIENMPLEKVPL